MKNSVSANIRGPKMHRFIDPGTITSVKGIKAAGIFCGIKKKRKDLALIVSDEPCSAAGTYTLNKVKAAPLLLTQKTVKSGGKVKAVLINSGNANACTGDEGYKDALNMQKWCAEKLNLDSSEVLIASTGVIGQKLPVEKIGSGLDEIIPQLSSQGGFDAAEAIMTTDTKQKNFAVKVQLSGGEAVIGGICKGSGMIAPNMATMLGFIATDAAIKNELLQSILSSSVKKSFNRISVDGETSTNDMVILMANGMSGAEVKDGSDDQKKFEAALTDLCIEMAKSIVSDGEGATKLVTLNIKNAKSVDDADLVGKSIANSSLVKTAIYGADANWGRIISAAGQSGAEFEPENVSISFDELPVLKPGYEVIVNEEAATEILSKNQFIINVDLGSGDKNSTWWTCDFTEGYIKINASYRT